MFKRILVPLDGSTFAERAIPHAEEFARIFGASIILLRVLEATSMQENKAPVDPLRWQIRKAEADMYLRVIASRIREHLQDAESQVKHQTVNEERVEYAIREGRAAENIINFAHSENIDLLVISTHGWGGLSRWNISSVTQKVVNMIYLPVLIVRAYTPSESMDARIRYRRILIPIDGSRRAECAFSAGIALAREGALPELASDTQEIPFEDGDEVPSPSSTKLLLATVIKPPELPIPEPYPVEIEKLFDQLMQLSRQAVKDYLNEIKERLPVACETRW